MGVIDISERSQLLHLHHFPVPVLARESTNWVAGNRELHITIRADIRRSTSTHTQVQAITSHTRIGRIPEVTQLEYARRSEEPRRQQQIILTHRTSYKGDTTNLSGARSLGKACKSTKQDPAMSKRPDGETLDLRFCNNAPLLHATVDL